MFCWLLVTTDSFWSRLDSIATVAGNGSKVYAYCLGSRPTHFHMFSPTLVGQLSASCRLVWDHKPFGSLLPAPVVPNMEWHYLRLLKHYHHSVSQELRSQKTCNVPNCASQSFILYGSCKKGCAFKTKWSIKHNVLYLLYKEHKLWETFGFLPHRPESPKDKSENAGGTSIWFNKINNATHSACKFHCSICPGWMNTKFSPVSTHNPRKARNNRRYVLNDRWHWPVSEPGS